MRIILILAFAICTLAAKPASAETDELTAYVNDFFQQSGPKYRRLAVNEYIPLVVTYSKEYKIDPLLVATVITHESGWRKDVVGKTRDEIGLMQVHGLATGEARRRKVSLRTAEGQLIAGIHWLSAGLDKCKGDLVLSMGWYMTGKCKSIRAARMRARHYQKAVRMFRVEVTR